MLGSTLLSTFFCGMISAGVLGGYCRLVAVHQQERERAPSTKEPTSVQHYTLYTIAPRSLPPCSTTHYTL
jgi:hypothetical protein